MNKKLLSIKTLLVAAGLCVGASAWAEETTVYSWDFTNYAPKGSAAWLPIDKDATSVNILSTDLYPATDSKFSGLYGWHNGSNAGLRLDKTAGLRAYSSGGDVVGIPELVTGDVISIVGSRSAGTHDLILEVSDNATLTKIDADNYTIIMKRNGNLGFRLINYNAVKSSSWYGLRTVKVTRDLSVLTSRMSTAKIAGTALASSVMKSSVKTALTTALASEYVDMEEASITSSNISAYATALESLEAAVANAQTSADNFAILNNLIGKANVFAETVTSYVSPSGAETVYTEDAEVDPVALAAAVRAAVISAGTVADNTDITAIIANSSFELVSTLGWNVATVDANDNYTVEEGGIFYTNPNGNTVSQTIGTLPAGKYTLAADASSWGAGMYLIMNGTHNTVTVIGADGYATQHIEYTFTLASATEVTIGVNSGDQGNSNAFREDGGYWGYRVDNFTLTYVGQDELAQAKAALTDEISDATAVKNSWAPKVGTTPFKYASTYYDVLVAELSEAQAVIEANGDEVDAYTDAKDELVAAKENVASSVQNLPDADKYYRIYLANDGVSTGKNLNLLKGSTNWLSITEAPYAVKFTLTDGYYVIRDAYDNYIAAGKTNNFDWGTYSSGQQSNSEKWEITLQDDGTIIMYNQNANYKGWGWRLGTKALTENAQVACYYSDKSSPSNVKWIVSEPVDVTDVTLSVNATAGWGTFIAPYDNLTPSTVKAYTVSYTENNVVYFTENETGVLSANTPYILSTEEADDVSKTFTGIANNDNDTYAVNGLVGLLTASEVPANSYVLQYNDGKVGFYKTTEAITGTANRCYLDLSSVATEASSRATIFFDLFDSETAGIAQVEDGKLKMEDCLYNLNGQRISKPAKGLYIVNGKKVIIK